MPAKSQYRTFGHELYADVALKALRLLEERPTPRAIGADDSMGAGGVDRVKLRDAIARLLPPKSITTRRAVANKIIQRFLIDETAAPNPDVIRASSFVRLINGLHDSRTRRQLLFWQLTRVETIVGALSRHILYPYLILGRVPGGWDKAEFHVVNGEQLFVVERFITFPFVAQFAQRAWSFTSRPTLSRSLRALAQCGRLATRKLKDLRYHPQVFFYSQEPIQLACFIYGVYQEWLPTHARRAISIKGLAESRFARTMLLPPQEVGELARRATRYQFFTPSASAPTGRGPSTRVDFTSIRLAHRNMEELVEAILNVAI